MKITINNKEYKSVKMTRKYYKMYTDAYKILEGKSVYEDDDLDLMIKILVKLYDNNFTEDDINNELSVYEIVYNFMMLQENELLELNKKIEKTQKAFLKGK
ncbi:phage tail assembly chaperone G [Clostridium cadaveris]|uniref:phage tail assembly chaperone G n=1 Tax=Clostridium cadaveris TaxID=1529 RepID=UPI0039935E28